MAIETAPGKGVSTGIMTDPRVLHTLPLDLRESAQVEVASENALTPDLVDQIRFEKHYIPIQTPLEQLMANRPKINPIEFMDEFKSRINYKEKSGGGRMKIVKDVIGVVRHLPGGHTQTYPDKLRKEEEEKKKKESASFGVATLGGQEFVFYPMYYDFFQGTLGEIAGDMFMRAAEYAIQHKLPLVAAFSSAGARQQENTVALVQMNRMIAAIEKFKRETNLPYIGVVDHQVWGGISASAVPQADVIIGLQGSDYGFSGPKVIETHTQKPVAREKQSVEENVLNRQIDLIVRDQDELTEWLTQLMKVSTHVKEGHKNTESVLPIIEKSYDRFPSGDIGFLSLSRMIAVSEASRVGMSKIDSDGQKSFREFDLYQRYGNLKHDSARPDTEYIMRQGFASVLPLYSSSLIERQYYDKTSFRRDKMIAHPAIIASLCLAGDQPILVIGNQHSYIQRIDGSWSKAPSGPGPADFEYQQRMLAFAERMGIPVVSLVDTFGAVPTIEAEQRGQSRAISDSLMAVHKYKKTFLTYIIGALGSGGGLAMTGLNEDVNMVEDGTAYVAEPGSATSILTGVVDPEPKVIARTMKTMRVTAQDQKELQIVDHVIPVGKIGPEAEPLVFVENIIQDVAENLERHIKESDDHRRDSRYKKLRNLRAFPRGKHKEEISV